MSKQFTLSLYAGAAQCLAVESVEPLRGLFASRCIIRNPSRSSFYVAGIVREFKEASGFALCVILVAFVFGLGLVNLIFQH